MTSAERRQILRRVERLQAQASAALAQAATSIWPASYEREAGRLRMEASRLLRDLERRLDAERRSAAARQQERERAARQQQRQQERERAWREWGERKRIWDDAKRVVLAERNDQRVIVAAQDALGVLPVSNPLAFAHVLDVATLATQVGGVRRVFGPSRPGDIPSVARGRRNAARYAIVLASEIGFGTHEITAALNIGAERVEDARAWVKGLAPTVIESLRSCLARRGATLREFRDAADSAAEEQVQRLRAQAAPRTLGRIHLTTARARWESEMDRGWSRLSTSSHEDDVIARLDLERALSLMSDEDVLALRRLSTATDAEIKAMQKMARVGDFDLTTAQKAITKLRALMSVMDAAA